MLNWTNITEVSFAPLCLPTLCSGPARPNPNTYFAIDNLTLTPSAVPLPGTLPLFAGGLGVIALLRRRARKAQIRA